MTWTCIQAYTNTLCCRFDEIMRALHFTDNHDPPALQDRAWKLRSVVDCVQKTFRRAYEVPNIISFDEGILPSQSAFNGMKTYMKDKPHKWGTKLFISCCARTAFCLRYVPMLRRLIFLFSPSQHTCSVY